MRCCHHCLPPPICSIPSVSCLCYPDASFLPPRWGRSHWRDTLKLVRLRIKRWQDGRVSELWEEAMCIDKDLKSHLSCLKPSAHPSEFLPRSNIIRARRSVEDGQYKKALQSLTSYHRQSPNNTRLDPTFGYLLLNPPAISSSGAPFLYGKAMLRCGHAISLSKPHLLMGSADNILVLVFVFVVYVFCCFSRFSLFCFFFFVRFVPLPRPLLLFSFMIF